MKVWKLVVALVIVLLLAFATLYLWQLFPLALRLSADESKIEETKKRTDGLETRATADEQKLDDHEKRLVELEKARKAAESDLAAQRSTVVRLEAEVEKLRTQVSESARVSETREAERARRDEETRRLLEEIGRRDADLATQQRELLKRVETLEKLTEGKAQR